MLVPIETLKILDRIATKIPFKCDPVALFAKAVSLPTDAFCDVENLAEMVYLGADAESVEKLQRLSESIGIASWLCAFEAVRMLENLIDAGAVITDDDESTLLVIDELIEDEDGNGLTAKYREL